MTLTHLWKSTTNLRDEPWPIHSMTLNHLCNDPDPLFDDPDHLYNDPDPAVGWPWPHLGENPIECEASTLQVLLTQLLCFLYGITQNYK
jgi:hypothetical protein